MISLPDRIYLHIRLWQERNADAFSAPIEALGNVALAALLICFAAARLLAAIEQAVA